MKQSARRLAAGGLGLALVTSSAAYRLPAWGRQSGRAAACGGVPCAASSSSSGNADPASLRVSYSKQGLDEGSLATDPHVMFRGWFEEACSAKVIEPNAMCLSTCADNKPSARYVLLKGHDERGFVWYTNYNSRKAAELTDNPYAALTFWWGDLERSVRIEGRVVRVSAEESDAYFQSRPRGSQLGAWTSNQSSDIQNRDALERQEREIIARFDSAESIPRPPHWWGFRLEPSRIEFWKGRESRLHDRIVFERAEGAGEGGWERKRLQP